MQQDEHVWDYIRAQLLCEVVVMLDQCGIADTLLKVCAIGDAQIKPHLMERQ